MLTLTFHRFVIDPDSVSTQPTNHLVKKAQYETIVDHSQELNEMLYGVSRARLMAHLWLTDHFGYVIIDLKHQNNINNRHIKICNHKTFIHRFAQQLVLLQPK